MKRLPITASLLALICWVSISSVAWGASATFQQSATTDYVALVGGMPVEFGEMYGGSGTSYGRLDGPQAPVTSGNQSSQVGLQNAATNMFEGSLWVFFEDGNFAFVFPEDSNPIPVEAQLEPFIPGTWEVSSDGTQFLAHASLSYTLFGSMSAQIVLEGVVYTNSAGELMASAVYWEQSGVAASVGANSREIQLAAVFPLLEFTGV